ncbi:MAG: transposase [Burkholderiales bacterium]
MTKSKFRGEQIVHALRQADGGTAFGAVCRQFGASQATSRVWTKKTGQLGLNEREE